MRRTPSKRFKNSLLSCTLEAIDRVVRGKETETLRKLCDPVQYLRQFATVRIGLPRRMGNTTLAEGILRSRSDSVFVALNLDLGKAMEKALGEGFRRRIHTPATVKRRSLAGAGGAVVVVDCSPYLEEEVMDEIYRSNPKVIVALGV